MWSFEPYKRQQTIIPDNIIMSMRTGLESRYAERFRGYAGTTDEAIKHTDNAKKTADSLRTAAGIVDTQKENIDELFTTAELMVKMIDDFQRESGVKQIRNIPLAGDSIKASSGKKLGYTKLSMKFVSAGLLHFMEMSLAMMEDLKEKDKVIQSIAEHRVDIPIIGRLMEVELDDIASDDPIAESKIPLDQNDDDLNQLFAESSNTPVKNSTPAPQIPSALPLSPPKTPKPVEKKVTGKSSPITPTNKVKK